MKPPAGSLLARITDAVLAKPGVRGWLSPAIQLVLIVLWYPLLLFLLGAPALFELMSSLRVGVSRLWHAMGLASPYTLSLTGSSGDLASGELLTTLGVLLIAVPVTGVLAYIPFTLLGVVPRKHPEGELRVFVRCWWRAALWATLLVPIGACAIAVLGSWDARYWVFEVPDWVLIVLVNGCLWAYFLGAPTFLGARELRFRRQRLARWRPVCPECAYSLRRLHGDRCPECGTPFPTTSRTFRRWAIQRLIWDRASRGSLLIAYLRSAFTITFCPCRAGRRLGIPDRYGRAVRWAVAHLLLAVLICTAGGGEPWRVGWVLRHLSDAALSQAPETAQTRLPSTGRVIVWTLQSLIAWLIALGLLPLLGMTLGAAVPGCHPVAKRGIVKWSLYASFIILPVLIAWYAARVAAMPWRQQGTLFVFVYGYLRRPPLALLAGLYALWWARGVCVNPYLHKRGFNVLLVNWFVFVAAWLMLTWVLLNPGPLEDLL